MKKYTLILFLAALVAYSVTGCAYEASGPRDAGSNSEEVDPGLPRLVVSGLVSDTAGHALEGISVAVYGVREHDEQPLITYNYALTDTAGQYTIIRYRGRELPTEVTVVATDSAGIYREQTIYAPVTYDSIPISDDIKQPYDAFATADFVLSQENSQP